MPSSGLVEKLQSDALDLSVSITDLVRKAKTVAFKLKQDELTNWLEKEINGYTNEDKCPEYRRLPASIKFRNPYYGWCPVIESEHIFPYGGPIGQIETLLASPGDAMTAVPKELTQKVCRDAGFNAEVRRWISRPAISGISDAVRNTIHDWALRLERAGVSGAGMNFSAKEEETAQNVTINIGSIANAAGIGAFSHSSVSASQTSSNLAIIAKEIVSLVDQIEQALPASTLSDTAKEQIAKATSALRTSAEIKSPDPKKISGVLRTLRAIFEKAASDLMATGAIHVIDKILASLHSIS